MVGIIYRCSDGRFYGDVDLWERFETGEWIPCCWDPESGREWVKTERGALLLLEPDPEADVPDDRIERAEAGIALADDSRARARRGPGSSAAD